MIATTIATLPQLDATVTVRVKRPKTKTQSSSSETIGYDPTTGLLLVDNLSASLSDRDQIIVSVRVNGDPRIVGVNVDRNHNCSRRKNQDPFGGVRYEQKMSVGLTKTHLDASTSQVRIAEVRFGNLLIMHQYGIVAQDGELFLVQGIQRISVLNSVVNHDAKPWGFLAPDLSLDRDGWNSLEWVVAEADLVDVGDLSPKPDWDAALVTVNSDIPAGYARVDWYDPMVGYGCVDLPTGVKAYVNREELTSFEQNTLRRLRPGELVTFGEQRPRTVENAGFPYSIHGVSVAQVPATV